MKKHSREQIMAARLALVTLGLVFMIVWPPLLLITIVAWLGWVALGQIQ